MKRSIGILLMLMPTFIYAVSDAHLSWKCTIRDADKAHWTNESVLKRKAANTVFDACKNESAVPATCMMEHIDCISYFSGNSPLWQCTAFDKNADVWYGNISAHRDDAALNAKKSCMKQSIIPDTCYMRLMTCQNKNDAL